MFRLKLSAQEKTIYNVIMANVSKIHIHLLHSSHIDFMSSFVESNVPNQTVKI